MSMVLLTCDCTVVLRSPFLFPGLAAGAWGVDVAALRDEAGRPIIPADQIRGVIKDGLRVLPHGLMPQDGPLCLEALFGAASDQEDSAGAANRPKRRRIHFSDLVSDLIGDLTAGDCTQAAPSAVTRIQIDEATGSVKDGALQVLEQVAAPGAEVRFSGQIQAIVPEEEADRLVRLLGLALTMTGSIGAVKSAGYGEVLHPDSSVTRSAIRPLGPVVGDGQDGGRSRWRLTVTFDRPVLVNTRRIADNAVASAAVFPGAAFKGALADRLAHGGQHPEDDSPLGRALAGIRFSHAWPLSADGQRLLSPLPLSLVAEKQDDGLQFGDALAIPEGAGAMIGDRPGLFPPDWKDPWFAGALKALGWPDASPPPTAARTHVAIDPDSGTARDQALFTTVMQGVRQGDGTPVRWELEVDASALTDPTERALARAMVQAMVAEGLYGFGGTGATVTVADAGEPPDILLPQGEEIALRLLTPAVLCHAGDIWPEDGGATTPQALYGAYFAGAVPGCTLRSVYAAQSLAGGYQARRRRAYGAGVYFPFVLTDPGAVFLLHCPTPESRAALVELIRRGLAPPPFRGTAMTWRNCPFVPENGYGAVCVDDLSRPERQALLKGVRHV